MQIKAGSDLVRRQNRAVVIAALRRNATISRTDLSATTGLSPSTVSAITADLIAEGTLVELREFEAISTKRGRPQIAMALNPQRAHVVSVELTHNQLSVGVSDYAGKTIHEVDDRFSTASCPADELLKRFTQVIRMALDNAKVRNPASIVVAIQGRTDAQGRDLLWSPIATGRDVHLADYLEAEFSCPVTVANDCSMIAAALRASDPERYGRDVLAVLLSHGIGMGLYLNGRLFTGRRSSAAEFGHMLHKHGGALCRCGSRGCIEAYAGDYAIWRNAHGLPEDAMPPAELDGLDLRALALKARQSDGPERRAFKQAAEAIGTGLASIFALIDPVPIAFVGSGTAAFDIAEPYIRACIAESNSGAFSDHFEFDIYESELPLIRKGATVTGLAAVDEMISVGGDVVFEQETPKLVMAK
ncbi:MAG: ROK family transcriptional regulator [Rhizobiaceae bacterium]